MIATVLAGGPDAERAVSIASATAVAEAIDAQGEFSADLRVIDRPGSLGDVAGDVIVPVLHGSWGEGGPLQDLLEREGCPYVGCGPSAARLCMDKLAAKLAAERVHVRTPGAAVLNPRDPVPPMDGPAVVKPIFEGSSVGLHLCHDRTSLERACSEVVGSATPIMIERLIPGREITCGLLDTGEGLRPLPLVEIVPADGVYDYAAKYDRDDTRYFVGNAISPGVDHAAVQRDSLTVAAELGVRHLARVDFMVDDRGDHWMLEINTMPGFTGHSLLPKAAAASGIPMPELCTRLCRLAVRDHSSPGPHPVETKPDAQTKTHANPL